VATILLYQPGSSKIQDFDSTCLLAVNPLSSKRAEKEREEHKKYRTLMDKAR
jgi:hypothetical protein